MPQHAGREAAPGRWAVSPEASGTIEKAVWPSGRCASSRLPLFCWSWDLKTEAGPAPQRREGHAGAEEGDVEDMGCVWCRGRGKPSRDQEGRVSLPLLSSLGPCGPGESWPVQVVKERSGRKVGEGEHLGGRLRGALPRSAGHWSGKQEPRWTLLCEAFPGLGPIPPTSLHPATALRGTAHPSLAAVLWTSRCQALQVARKQGNSSPCPPSPAPRASRRPDKCLLSSSA